MYPENSKRKTRFTLSHNNVRGFLLWDYGIAHARIDRKENVRCHEAKKQKRL
jgi:hypothetical protein